MSRTLIQTFNPAVLKSTRGRSTRGSAKLDGYLSVALGQALAKVTGTVANHWQSITATSGTAGSATFSFNGETFTVAYNSSAAALIATLEALSSIGSGNVTVTAASSTLDAGALTIKFQGKLAGITQPPILLVSNGITGATPTIDTAAQTCVPNGRLVAWDPSRLANPSLTAVTGVFTAGGSDGSIGAGTYALTVTWSTAQGETLSGFVKMLTLTSAQHITIAAINSTNTPDYATAINIYLNGMHLVSLALASPGTTSANLVATDITAPGAVAGGGATVVSAAAGRALPSANTAYIKTDGRHLFDSFSTRQQATDNFGRVYDSTTPVWDNGAMGKPEGDIMLGGVVLDSDLVGFDGYEQLWLDQVNGRVISGVLANSAAEYFFGPEGS